jgi:hypothetical protein
MPSPVAVDSASSSPSIERSTVARSVVGGTMMDAVPAKLTSATLNLRGNELTNSLADSFAASSRFGSMSVAIIDSDTSIATTIVARSRGTLTWSFGCANATMHEQRGQQRQPDGQVPAPLRRRGATRSSRAMLVKRSAYCAARCWR